MSTTNRRDYGTGSIYRRCDTRRGCPPAVDGTRPPHKCTAPWVGALVTGFTASGAVRRRTVSAPTEAQVKVKLRKLAADLADGATASDRTTVKIWAAQWLDIAERRLRPQPFVSARSAVNRWIIPTIGHRRLSELTPGDVRSVSDAQRRAGLTTSTQRRAHSVLVSMLKAARADGYPVPARVVEVTAPAASVSDRVDIPAADAIAMLEVAAVGADGSRWAAALLQGMRQAECLGLTWDAVDLERRILSVTWQLQPIPYRVKRDRSSGFRVPDGYEARQLSGRWHLVRPKTRAGIRIIPIVEPMAAALAAWAEVAPTSPHGLVWPSPDGGPRDPRKDDAAWYALQEAAGVTHPAGRRFTIHEARHTTATLLMEAGVAPAVIKAIVGHSTMLSTNAYLHVNTAPLAAAVEAVAQRLALRPAE